MYGIKGGQLINVANINRWIRAYNHLARYQVNVQAKIGDTTFSFNDTLSYWFRHSSYYSDRVVLISIHYLEASNSDTFDYPELVSMTSFSGTAQTITLQNNRSSSFTALDTNFKWVILSSEYSVPASGSDWYNVEMVPGFVQGAKDFTGAGFQRLLLCQVKNGVTEYSQVKSSDLIEPEFFQDLHTFLSSSVWYSFQGTKTPGNILAGSWSARAKIQGETYNPVLTNAEFVVQQIGAENVFPQARIANEGEYIYQYIKFFSDIQTKTGFKVQAPDFDYWRLVERYVHEFNNVLASAIPIQCFAIPRLAQIADDYPFSSAHTVTFSRNMEQNKLVGLPFQSGLKPYIGNGIYRNEPFFLDVETAILPPSTNIMQIGTYTSEPILVGE